MSQFAPTDALYTTNVFCNFTNKDLERLLWNSIVHDGGVQRNHVLPDYSTEHLIGVVSVISSARAIIERTVGCALNVIIYPELQHVQKISEKFILDKPFRAKKVEPTKIAPCAKIIEITKHAETIVIASAYKFSADVLASLAPILAKGADNGDGDDDDKGIVRHAKPNFFHAFNRQHRMVCESFVAGTIGEWVQNLKTHAEDILIKEAILSGKEESTSKVLIAEESKLAEIIENYANAKTRCTGLINKTVPYFLQLVQKATELVKSLPLIHIEENPDTVPQEINAVIDENDNRVVGVLIVGTGARAYLPTSKMKVIRDVRRAMVEFVPRDYQYAMETKWIISSPDEYSERQKKVAEKYRTLHEKDSDVVVKNVVRAEKRAYASDKIPTTHKTENASTRTIDVDVLDIDGKIVLVECLDDVFSITDDLLPLRDKLNIISGTILGSTAAMCLHDPKRNVLPSAIELQHENKTVRLAYRDTLTMLTCARFFDDQRISKTLNRNLRLGNFNQTLLKNLHYCPAATTTYATMAFNSPPFVRNPQIGTKKFHGNRAQYIGSLTYETSCSPLYHEQTLLELSPVFDFYLVKKKKKQGQGQWETDVLPAINEDNLANEDIATFEFQGFPRRIQGNIPICYTGPHLWFGQAHQLLSVCGQSETNRSVAVWKDSLETKEYWFELYVIQYILCCEYKNVESIIASVNKKDDNDGEFSKVRYLFAIADLYYERTNLLAFPQNLACLCAWSSVTQHPPVKKTISEILHFLQKLTNGLVDNFKNDNFLNEIGDVLTHLSPLTDPNVPCAVNVRCRATNLHFNPSNQKIQALHFTGEYYTWVEDDNSDAFSKQTYWDNVRDKVFLSCVCALCNDIHVGSLNGGEIIKAYTNKDFFLIKNDKLINYEPEGKKNAASVSTDQAPEAPETDRTKKYEQLTMYVKKTLKKITPMTNHVFRFTSSCPDSMHSNEKPLYNRYTFLTNGIIFLPASIKTQWAEIDCSNLVNFIYLEPRLASPRVPFIICSGKDESQEGFVGLGSTGNAAFEHPDTRFYTVTEHDYQPNALLTQQKISRHFSCLSPVITVYAYVATQFRLDPIAFEAYVDKINPPFAFTVLRTATYRTEHAFYVSKKGSNVLIAPENVTNAIPDNTAMTIQVNKRMAFIDNAPGSAFVCLPNVFVRGLATSRECFLRDYFKLPRETAKVDRRSVFLKLGRLHSLHPNTNATLEKSVGHPAHTIIDILPCPCPTKPELFETPMNPTGRDLAFAYVDPKKQTPSALFFDHSQPDCHGLATFNPWGSKEGCLGFVFYGESFTPLTKNEGFFPFYKPLSFEDNVSDMSSMLSELKSKCADTDRPFPYFSAGNAKCQNPSSLFLQSYPQYSFTPGAREARDRHELPNYLIKDIDSPLAGTNLPKIRGNSCLSGMP